MSKLKRQARSIGDRLSAISKTSGVSYQLVLTEFLLERLAVRLVENKNLSECLVFKGGYVSLRVYNSPRYTVDLDALLMKGSLEKTITIAARAAETDLGDGVWFRSERSVDLETQGEYGGHRIVFRCGLGELLPDLRRAQVVNLDVGKGDPVVPGHLQAETPFLLGGGSLSWQVYPVETTVAEKLHALILRGAQNSRAKDIFDLVLLLPKCESGNLKAALTETFRYRGETLPTSIAKHVRGIDKGLLEKGWKSAVGEIQEAKSFAETYDMLVKQLSDRKL